MAALRHPVCLLHGRMKFLPRAPVEVVEAVTVLSARGSNLWCHQLRALDSKSPRISFGMVCPEQVLLLEVLWSITARFVLH